MEEQQFWSIVAAARVKAGDDMDARVDALGNELRRLPAEEVQAFQHKYDEYIHKANRWDLWGAAYLMNGGCSDDGFCYFCHWLISEGKEVFDAALNDPDSLTLVPRQDYFELESYAYVALEVFKEKTGDELKRDFTIEMEVTAGEQWDEDDLPTLFPRLSAAYGG